MLASDLLDRLERLGLLDQEIIEALREQLSQSGARVTPEKIAQLLVENGQLTRFQATKLIGELRSDEYPEEAVEEPEAVEELDLLDADSDAGDFAQPVEETGELWADAQPADAAAWAGNDPAAEPMPEDAEATARPRKINKTKKVRDQSKSVWDSFKIYGVAGIVILLTMFGALLYFVLSKGNADELIAHANQAYDQQSYAAAEKEFAGFLASFGQSHPHASTARTRLTMAQLYQIAQYSDPVQAVDASEELLPKIEHEEALESERNNLAALLVDIADNLARAAAAAPETQEKQRLLDELDRQIKITENPMYVTASARQALSSKLMGINESRARVQRDINRNLRLDEAVAQMDAALQEQRTKDAYDIRTELLRDYPELRTHARLNTLVQSASEIQQTLVKTSTQLPAIETSPRGTDSLTNVVLTNRTGEAVPGLSDEVIYVRAHGAVLAFAAADGRLLWRRYVGYGQSHAPLAIDPSGRDGVLLSDADALEVQRGESDTGEIRWRAAIEEPFSQPVTHRDTIYLATDSGRVISLDAETGDANWATQIPQSLQLSPGINDRAGKLYLPGNHSNLYVLDQRNGQCSESFYLGHAAGTVAVAPVALQGGDGGHVFVFENAGADFARMHVLKCDASGGGLQVAQPPFRLVGNVTVDPVLVLGRRLIVLTDRAQVAVFDIEQTAATTEQVSLVAEQVASYDSPTNAQMAVGKNQMWVSGTRIGRYELQVSTGRVARDWVFHEGDAFIGKPQAMEEAIFHARVLRGTSGIRVTAADPKSGRPYWQNDVGVPVAMLKQAPGGKAFHIVTTQAALFELDAEALAQGATSGPIENPGGNGVAMRFEHPVQIDERRAVLLNQATGSQLCVYDPTRSREKLRLITLSLPAGNAVGNGLISGNGFLLPLDSGRIVLMNYQTGGQLGSPFQPPSKPDESVQWSAPVRLPSDPDQVLIADSRKKLYRLRVGEQVRELASVDLEQPLLGATAIVGQSLFAATAGPSADFLVAFDSGSLEVQNKHLLDGRITWGPYAAGSWVLVRTDDGQLRGFTAEGQPSFAVPLPEGKLVAGVTLMGMAAGDAAASAGEEKPASDAVAIVAGQAGWLVSVSLADGQLVGQRHLGQPLSAPPLLVGKRLLVPGSEGIVYITEVPTSVDES